MPQAFKYSNGTIPLDQWRRGCTWYTCKQYITRMYPQGAKWGALCDVQIITTKGSNEHLKLAWETNLYWVL